MRGWGRRGYNWEFSAGVQQEIVPRVSADLSYFRRWYGNFTVTDNLTLASTDFDSFGIPAPVDPRLPGGGGGYTVSGLYDLNPLKFGQPANNFVTRASDYGQQLEHWNGFDFSVNARLRQGLLFQGGLGTGRTTRDSCEIRIKLPETATLNPYCHVSEAFLTQIKALGSYAIPKFDLLVSATLQSLPGTEIAANYTAPNSIIAPSLGRNLSGAANATVNLVEPGTMYTDRFNEVDIRVAKSLRYRQTRTTVNFDLYNVFNSNTALAVNNSYGTWLRPTSILAARLFRISAKFDF